MKQGKSSFFLKYIAFLFLAMVFSSTLYYAYDQLAPKNIIEITEEIDFEKSNDSDEEEVQKHYKYIRIADDTHKSFSALSYFYFSQRASSFFKAIHTPPPEVSC